MTDNKLDLILDGINQINNKLDALNTKELKESLDELKSLVVKRESLITDEITKLIDTKINNNITQIESLMAIYNFLPEVKFLPTSRGWAGSPDFLLKVLEIIFKKKPNVIVELGSGLSTIIIGSALKKLNKGCLFSLDHEEGFLNNTRENADFNNISEFVNLNYTPLIEYDNNYKWYDINKVNIQSKIDILIVDGPPRIIQQNARYPALPLLLDKLSDDSIIILDDANRTDEKTIIDLWSKYLNNNCIEYMKEDFEYFDKGLTIFYINKIKRLLSFG